MALASHFISKNGFAYVFPGKFTSDPIEGWWKHSLLEWGWRNLLIAMADRGGLTTPKQYCLAIYALGVQVYYELSRNESIRQKFLSVKNQRSAFTDLANENADHTFLLQQTCDDGHASFKPILRSLFNCFAKTNWNDWIAVKLRHQQKWAVVYE